MSRLSRTQRKAHNGLGIRHPALLNIDSMELIAVAEFHRSPSVHVGAPVPEAPPKPTVRPKIAPDQKPICQSDYWQ